MTYLIILQVSQVKASIDLTLDREMSIRGCLKRIPPQITYLVHKCPGFRINLKHRYSFHNIGETTPNFESQFLHLSFWSKTSTNVYVFCERPLR